MIVGQRFFGIAIQLILSAEQEIFDVSNLTREGVRDSEGRAAAAPLLQADE